MTPQNRTATLVHLAHLLAFALEADEIGETWALLAWVEKIAKDASVLADDLLEELRLEILRERG